MAELLLGSRISLRPIADADTDNIVRWRNSDSVRRYFLDQRLFTPQSHRQWMQTRVNTGQVAQFIITRLDTGEDIGSVYLRDIDRDNLTCESGIFLGEDSARGKGFGSEACRMACRFAFETLGMERVFLRVLADNTAAIRSYQHAGFRQKGLLRQHILANGVRRDLLLMGMLKGELLLQNREGESR